jgi:hypothetical protein
MVGASGDSNMGVARTRTNKGILNWWGLEPIRDNCGNIFGIMV